MFTAAVVTLAWIAFSVLVGEYAALCFEDPGARVVFGGNELDVVFLADAFGPNRGPQFVVEAGDFHTFTEHKTYLWGGGWAL